MAKKKFRILYDTTIISSGLYKDSNRSGIYFVAYNILMELMQRVDIEIGFYCQDFYKGAVTEFFRLKSINEWGIPEAEWKPVSFVEDGEIGGYDAFFSPVFKVPDSVKECRSIKKYVLLYDAIPFLYKEYYPDIDTDYWLKDLVESMNSEEEYFTISVNTKNDFIKIVPVVPQGNYTPVMISYDNSMFENASSWQDICDKYGIDTEIKYYFSLCSIQPRKNIARVVRSFIKFVEKNKIDDLILVLAGAKEDDVYEKLGIEPECKYVKFLGYVDDCEKKELYSNAHCFVYTSQYEGFGMPPLEAMACGCPVITSNNSSLPEVVGETGILVDWDSDEQHMAAFEKMYYCEDVAEEKRRALARARDFSWSKTVDEILWKMREDNGGMKLNIGWDATAIYGPMSKNRGIGNYVTGLFSTLIDLDEDNHYYLFNVWENTSFKDQINHKERLEETYLYCGRDNDLLTNDSFKAVFANALKRFLIDNEIDVFFITSPFESRIFPYDKEWFGEVKTVTIVYDIIPYLFKERYFNNDIETNGRWYLDRLAMIREIDKSLAISESARQDLIGVLNFAENRVSTIWGAVDKKFVQLGQDDLDSFVKDKFGIKDRFIMCTGGDDDRKNLAGLIEAYSNINRQLIDEYQLVIVCKLSEGSLKRYRGLATKYNIEDRLVLTGFVDDSELVQLYNMASLVAFPSEYEGFGLPIVEAFACGTPVLTSNNSSLGEVAGDAAVLVDPFSIESITKGLEKALTETDLEELAKKGTERVTLFQWKNVAKDTLKALADVSKMKYRQSVKKIAMFTPLPPLYSGIADYSKDIIYELSKKIDIDIYIDDGYVADELGLPNVKVFNHKEFEQRYMDYDEVLYQLGNSEFHVYMWDYLQKYNGTIVLHDYNMHGVLNFMLGKTKDYQKYGEYLMEDFAAGAVRQYIRGIKIQNKPVGVHEIHANGFLTNYADKIIVHSMYNKKRLLERESGRNVFCIKHFAKIDREYDKNVLRKKYGYEEDDVLIASFGIVAPTKRIFETISAISDILKSNPKAKYLIIGGDVTKDKVYSRRCKAQADKLLVGEKIAFLGHADEKVMIDYMKMADICVNLRHPYGGESSGSFARLLGMGKALVVNKIGDFDEVPDDACVKIPNVNDMGEEQEIQEIRAAVNSLMNNCARQKVEEKALKYAQDKLDISKIAEEYLRCLNSNGWICEIDDSLKKIYSSEIANKKYAEEELEQLIDTIMYGKAN